MAARNAGSLLAPIGRELLDRETAGSLVLLAMLGPIALTVVLLKAKETGYDIRERGTAAGAG